MDAMHLLLTTIPILAGLVIVMVLVGRFPINRIPRWKDK